MKKIIVVVILVAIVSIIAITYASNSISLTGPNIVKPSGIATTSNVTGKHYQIGISEGIGLSDKP